MMSLQTNESGSRTYVWSSYRIKQRETEFKSNSAGCQPSVSTAVLRKETSLYLEHGYTQPLSILEKTEKTQTFKVVGEGMCSSQQCGWGYIVNFVPAAITVFKQNCHLILQGPSFPWLPRCSPKLQKCIVVIVQN